MVQAVLLSAILMLQGGQKPSDKPTEPQKVPELAKPISPDKDPKHQADLDHDAELGKKYAAEVLKQYKLSTNKDYIARVKRIGQEIAAISRTTQANASWGDKRLNPFDYDYTVIQGDDINAFSLPGGYVYVFEGLVKYVETDDELAGVLAHETAHVAFRHVATLQHEETKLQGITLPLVLLSVLAGGGGAGAFQTLELGQLVGMAAGSGWSLKAELAADSGGFQYLVKSKYNPTAMLTVMERLARDERNSPKISLGIFASHPPSRERAEAIVSQMAAANIPIERSAVTTTLRATEKPGDKGTVEIWFANRKIYEFAGDDALKRADVAVPRLNAMFDKTPELYEVQLDGHRVAYKNIPLIEMAPEDATAAKLNLDDLSRQTLKNIQGSLYVLAFRVWDER